MAGPSNLLSEMAFLVRFRRKHFGKIIYFCYFLLNLFRPRPIFDIWSHSTMLSFHIIHSQRFSHFIVRSLSVVFPFDVISSCRFFFLMFFLQHRFFSLIFCPNWHFFPFGVNYFDVLSVDVFLPLTFFTHDVFNFDFF